MVEKIQNTLLTLTAAVVFSVILMVNSVSAMPHVTEYDPDKHKPGAYAILGTVTAATAVVPAVLMALTDRDNDVISVIGLVPGSLAVLLSGISAVTLFADKNSELSTSLFLSGMFILNSAVVVWSIVRLAYNPPNSLEDSSYIQPAKASFGFAPLEDGLLFSLGGNF